MPAREGCEIYMRNTVCALTLNPAIDKTVYINDFTLNTVNRVGESCQVPGSKGVNVARIMAKCGVGSVCFGFIGGRNGGYVLSELEKEGVGDGFVRVDYDIRTNIKVVDLKNSTYTDINFDGGCPSAENMRQLREKTRTLASESAFVALGGSVPPGVDNAVYYELALIAQSEGARVSVDCYNEPLIKALAAKPYIIKPNIDELEQTFSEKYETVDKIASKAMEIYRGGVENVLVSLGGDGAVAVCGGDVFRLYTDDLPVYNTVGAGDAFLSGFIYGKHKGFDVVRCLKHSLSFSQAMVSSRADEVRGIAELTQYVGGARVEILSTGITG